jgi:hypothetical protein
MGSSTGFKPVDDCFAAFGSPEIALPYSLLIHVIIRFLLVVSVFALFPQ